MTQPNYNSFTQKLATNQTVYKIYASWNKNKNNNKKKNSTAWNNQPLGPDKFVYKKLVM